MHCVNGVSDPAGMDSTRGQAWQNDSGASMVEYALLLLLIAIVSVAILSSLGGTVAGDYGSVTSGFK